MPEAPKLTANPTSSSPSYPATTASPAVSPTAPTTASPVVEPVAASPASPVSPVSPVVDYNDTIRADLEYLNGRLSAQQEEFNAGLDSIRSMLESRQTTPATPSSPSSVPSAYPAPGTISVDPDDPHGSALRHLDTQLASMAVRMEEVARRSEEDRNARAMESRAAALRQDAAAVVSLFQPEVKNMVASDPYLKTNSRALNAVEMTVMNAIRTVASQNPRDTSLNRINVAALIRQHANQARALAESDPRVQAAMVASQKEINDQAVVAAGGSSPGVTDGSIPVDRRTARALDRERAHAVADRIWGSGGGNRFSTTN